MKRIIIILLFFVSSAFAQIDYTSSKSLIQGTSFNWGWTYNPKFYYEITTVDTGLTYRDTLRVYELTVNNDTIPLKCRIQGTKTEDYLVSPGAGQSRKYILLSEFPFNLLFKNVNIQNIAGRTTSITLDGKRTTSEIIYSIQDSVTVSNSTLQANVIGIDTVAQFGTWNVGLNTGVNTIGNINVNGIVPISGDVGLTNNDVDVLTLPNVKLSQTGTDNDIDVLSLPNEGQQTMANSISIAIASDQSKLPIQISQTTTDNDVDANITNSSIAVTQSGTWNVGLNTGSNVVGSINLNNSTKTLLFASIDINISGDNTLVTADASNKIKVVSYAFISDGTVNARWKSGAAINLSGAMALVINSGISHSANLPAWLLETAINQDLIINLSAGVGLRGYVCYFKEP